ncbi:hypothetical protein ACFYXF_12485 [Streptomyces sp. NPDC002680]|uniref:hypothetical protein n=1 Tax=Streptomyces sp. NPDC002680 TaxID=3364659 RepID=UPI0036CE79A0
MLSRVLSSTIRESPAFEQRRADVTSRRRLLPTLRTRRSALNRTFAIWSLGFITYYV